MGNEKSVLVVGGGISGLTLALALRRAGVRVQVAEVNTGPMFVNAGFMHGVAVVDRPLQIEDPERGRLARLCSNAS